jgi:hypothetical protein
VRGNVVGCAWAGFVAGVDFGFFFVVEDGVQVVCVFGFVVLVEFEDVSVADVDERGEGENDDVFLQSFALLEDFDQNFHDFVADDRHVDAFDAGDVDEESLDEDLAETVGVDEVVDDVDEVFFFDHDVGVLVVVVVFVFVDEEFFSVFSDEVVFVVFVVVLHEVCEVAADAGEVHENEQGCFLVDVDVEVFDEAEEVVQGVVSDVGVFVGEAEN